MKPKINSMFVQTFRYAHDGLRQIITRTEVEVYATYKIANRIICVVPGDRTNEYAQRKTYSISDYETGLRLGSSTAKKLSKRTLEELEAKLNKHFNGDYSKLEAINGLDFEAGYQIAQEALAKLTPTSRRGFLFAIEQYQLKVEDERNIL